MKIKKDDKVIVLSGKNKGKKGKVLAVFAKEAKVIVERVNVVKRHQKPTRDFQGGIIEKPMPMYASKVMLICPKCGEPSRVKGKKVEGKGVRACASCGEVVDKV
ncbi:50S ribosomal protein L24 [candidate division WOR-1 bacterium RIFCSPLOWO2_02_FULL_46_20]|uniref:Large ribosomal subunit protein uL24 n=2 Tax=Saganbacteria TaxID=1703751 RepID=A0A1F4R523_UNCSA|nr:MAG: 50S ribosomal protein L24 [candidate division WOR-1 bacterium RIFCSPHIGHO2_02_FULL_45_12]OGC03264.1 MAG: 50S ribosomal protein L24 [candidate division WOR-1 bacterium RIFCSPLOWO2_02_FULL_46_20]OGC08910.1 MAG: 50S ribosomal protein L24 [candidate division WOR-1 bacterium RIFCSPLOWO2_12_FULL_45_9]